MNKKVILVSAISIAAIGAMSLAPLAASALTTQAQAHNGGGYGASKGNGSQVKAEALNMTTEQLREQLQTKTLSEVITDQKMTLDQYHEKVQSAAQNRWQDMGLSEEEIQTRTQDQLDRQENCDGTGTNFEQGGHRGGQSR